jgi:glycosyltransferase involved in cell wall biosynthesis
MVNEKRKKNQLVSIIIPTYNRAWSIKESIDSVLSQDFNDFELIVIDDGSTDHTLGILNSYGKDILVIHQRNQGVSSARNRGLMEASGSFIAFLDSDDLWLPRKLSIQVDFFHSNPTAMICQTEEIWMRNNVRINPKKRHKKPSGIIFEPSLALCLVSPSAVMTRRNLFDEVGFFDETLPACEDYDLWLRISYKHPVYLIDLPLIIKRGGHDDQLSASAGLDRYRIKSLEKIIASDVLTGSQLRAAVKTLEDKCTIYATGCRKRGRLEEATYYEELVKIYRI